MLLERLAVGSNEALRAEALRSLKRRSRERARSMIGRLLGSDAPELRMTALDAIRADGDPCHRPAVFHMIRSEERRNVITRGRAVLDFLDARLRITKTAGSTETSR